MFLLKRALMEKYLNKWIMIVVTSLTRTIGVFIDERSFRIGFKFQYNHWAPLSRNLKTTCFPKHLSDHPSEHNILLKL